MTSDMELVVGADGEARCIYDEVLDLREIGKLQITRASHVEPDRDGSWWRIWGLLLGRSWGRSRAGRRRWGRRGGGYWLRDYRWEHDAGSRNTAGQSTLRCPVQHELNVGRTCVALDFALSSPPLPPPHQTGKSRRGDRCGDIGGGLGHDCDRHRRG